MITCEPRMSAYAQALRQSIEPGGRVVDLGAGPSMFALLACQMGAAHVTAIEPHASIEIGRRAAIDNDCADKITFVRDLSTNFVPDEKADVLVSDIRGVLPLFEHHIPTILDARERLLKPGGVMIPVLDRIYAALVEAPETYTPYHKPWLQNDYGVDLEAGHAYAINSWRRTCQKPEALMCGPQLFATLDYRTVEETNYRATLRFKATRRGTVHGILMWFDSELGPEVGFSNAPGEPEQVYGQAFFPIERPVTLGSGSEAQAEISATFVNGDYVWSWAFRATDTDGQEHAYRQSTFKGMLLSHETLAPRDRNFRPPASEEQDVDVACLGMFNGGNSLAEIAQELNRRFIGHFKDEAAAIEHVANLSARYNRRKFV
jgi:protein arginine N-methyltransferase 1